MKSIERRFNNIQGKQPGWSSYVAFAVAITGQKFSKESLHRWFNKLVEKDDYDKKDKRGIMKHLEDLTNS